MDDTHAILTSSPGEITVLTVNSPPVNALGHAVRLALDVGLRAALADETVKAVVIACAGRTFFAGADITEFGKTIGEPDLNAILALIEGATKPVVAAIHGTALGGGLELALACHYRIATPSAKIGLPEVNLGLLPGGGGTQRTPRLAGLRVALDLMVLGKPMSAEAALVAGLIDVLAADGALVPEAVVYAVRLVEEAAPLRRARDLVSDLTGEAAASQIATFTMRNARLFKGFKAPALIVEAIRAAANLPFDQGMKREAALFNDLMGSPESAAQRHIFFAERAAAKIPGLAKDLAAPPIASVAVIGAGTMGGGIAIAFLNAGLPVTLVDLNANALARGADHVTRTIRAAADKGRMTPEDAERQIACLKTTSQIGEISQADLVVEAVFERLDLKIAVFRQIDAVAKPTAILASNTSFLDLDAIAAATSRPQSVIGLHFFAPANIMRLLEVVRGTRTSDAVVAAAMGLGRTLSKVAVLSGACDGFIANRLMARRGEAAEQIILEGPAPWDVDRVMTDFGFPMGVFQMLDLVGLDVIGWDRDNSAGRTVQEILCEQGRWGQKTGDGYYDYDAERRATPSAIAEAVIRGLAVRKDVPQRAYSDAQIVETLLDPVVNEGAKLLEEGVALRASDIDIALVTGYGWPVYRGGPMFWGDRQGLDRIVARLRARIANGEALTLSPLLVEKAQAGRGFIED